jgi:hypothetical protein
MSTSMAPRPKSADVPGRPRGGRHRIALPPEKIAPTPAEVAPAPAPAVRPAGRHDRTAPPRPDNRVSVYDRTGGAIRRPAQISERCTGCGAPTLGRSGMVTELVAAGPVQALLVVACSACPHQRRRQRPAPPA